jgi:peptide-N4-(N-acetyl-beta-glucosaminyl)asparagine amidase
VGLDARLAVDIGGDHVWTEVWSAAAARWVHLDPCEAAWDQPLLYEAGWGKRLGYVLAIGRDGVVDVTRRYTQRFEEARQR